MIKNHIYSLQELRETVENAVDNWVAYLYIYSVLLNKNQKYLEWLLRSYLATKVLTVCFHAHFDFIV